MIAARSGRTDITNILLEGKHVNLDIQEENGDTAVIIAVKTREPDTLRELVRAGSDLNLQNNEGLTPLMIAAWRGTTADITKILLEGEHINLDIQEKRTGWSALHFSAERGDSATTEALLKAGANPHLKDKDGDTAVIMAVKSHEPDTLRELVRAGSDLNLQNNEGLTPLMIAARSERTDITNILLEGEHINLDIQEECTGLSALHFSADRGDSATTEALLKAGANLHLNDKDGDSALTLAAWCGHTNFVVKLVKAGADLDLQNKVQNYIEPLIAPRKIRFQHTTIIPYLIGERLVVTTADFSVLLRHCHRYRNVVRDSK
ncbi:Putative ankyrin repeat protein MM_0045 [Geodia barretti]|uniref:Ankyrin repeat protein MM_0045 n=1 Tax=Geodia barretti TaxID=519541 RepID=A0AA35TNN0_GEOBA|nr:Putative ankyrin repeat protein MM_0045 [Geodia barretti]